MRFYRALLVVGTIGTYCRYAICFCKQSTGPTVSYLLYLKNKF